VSLWRRLIKSGDDDRFHSGVAWWQSGSMSDLRSRGREFDPRPARGYVTTLGKSFTPMCLDADSLRYYMESLMRIYLHLSVSTAASRIREENARKKFSVYLYLTMTVNSLPDFAYTRFPGLPERMTRLS